MLNRNDELYFEPLGILKQLSDCDKAEMTEDELAFLCGLIKKNRPHKIVEIGVAAGGTTAVILNCIAMLGLETKVFSVDLLKNFYRDQEKEVGYLAQECKAMLDRKLEHILYTGKYAVERLETIGKDIDLLILDTVHSLPGEILDFLAYFPYLKQGSIVVLHDITLNYSGTNPYAYATKLLLDVVVANKIINLEINNNRPNIAAFVINEHTCQYMYSVFSALTITWEYLPDNREVSLYREWYAKFYSPACLDLFDWAVQMNEGILDRRLRVKREKFLESYQCIRQMFSKRVYVYGCGNLGRQFYGMLEKCKLELGGYVISDGQAKQEVGQPVFYLSELGFDEGSKMIFVGVSKFLQKEICVNLQEKGISQYVLPAESMYEFLEE